VAAFSRLDRLQRCLQSLASRGNEALPFQVVVVLNGGTPEVREFLHDAVEGVTLACSDVNAGFAGACNLARRYAVAPYLVLLNDDAEVEPGWLEQLVATAEAHPNAGAVGSAVLFPDGRLQEAGSIIWGDGSTSAVGRGSVGIGWEHDFVREVDYSSACSLLVRAETWDAVGGMSEDYFPAYYEDCDLCMRIRRLGQRVLFSPASRVRHHEGSSSDNHLRTFLILRNRRRFRAVWRHGLREHESPAPLESAPIERALHRGRRHPRRLLIVDDRLPDERVGSGFSRMWDVIHALADDYAISFWSSNVLQPTTD
jgi:GT2 family glycosyltransferase